MGLEPTTSSLRVRRATMNLNQQYTRVIVKMGYVLPCILCVYRVHHESRAGVGCRAGRHESYTTEAYRQQAAYHGHE